jgi:TPR repeat protein
VLGCICGLLGLMLVPGQDAFAADGMVRRLSPAFAAALTAYRVGDYALAYKKWLSLAQDGDPAAMRNVGHLYHYGQGPEQNFKRAVSWYKRAAETGLAGAQANFADMLARGQGLEPDHREAARWFLAAAVRGHVISQYRIGLHYLRGRGVKSNGAAALFWFRLAHKAGYKPATLLLPQAVELDKIHAKIRAKIRAKARRNAAAAKAKSKAAEKAIISGKTRD